MDGMKFGLPVGRDTLTKDAVAGLVLGVESVPDGLAAGLLAGVSPLAGLYAYLFGTVGGSFFTSSAFMAVQATGAMAIVIADVHAVHSAHDGQAALFTLSMLTGVVMLVAGLLRLGSVLRFVSNAVMVGFISAVGVNIILGQLANLTGYKAHGSNRVVRAINTLIRPSQLHWQSVTVGVVTIALILSARAHQARVARAGPRSHHHLRGGRRLRLERSKHRQRSQCRTPFASGAHRPHAAACPVPSHPGPVARVRGTDPRGSHFLQFPQPRRPLPRFVPGFHRAGRGQRYRWDISGHAGGRVHVGVLPQQGGRRPLPAGPHDRRPRDGAGDLRLRRPGRAHRHARLGRLLMLVGFRTIKPADLQSVWNTGLVQKVVLAVTFVLTLIIPLQYAVLAGVGLSVVLYVVRQSNRVTVKRWILDPDGNLIEGDPPAQLPANVVVVLQPYGSLFFAAAPAFESQLPVPEDTSRRSVVIFRLRGHTDLGTTFMQVLKRYASALAAVDSKLVIVSAVERIQDQLRATGVTDVIGADNIYTGDNRVGAALKHAYADATAWIEDQQRNGPPGSSR